MSNKTTIEIDGKNKSAITAINGVKTELNSLSGTVNGPLAGAMSNFAKFIPTAAIIAGTYEIGRFLKSTINTADEISKMSQKVGISTESLSTLKYAAELSDLSLDQMQGSLKKLSTNLYDVAHGQGKDAALAFNELGITSVDASGKMRQTEDVLLAVADKFSGMTDGTEKSALAIKLFGRAGLDMIPFLNQGKDGITALTDEAEKLGLKISSETGKAAEEFNDSITSMKAELTGLANEVLPALLPKLNKFTRGVRDLSDAVYDFSGETLSQGLMRAASNGFTLGINLEQVLGIEKLITEEYQRRQALNDQYGAHLQGIVDQHQALYDKLNGINSQEDKHLNTVKAIKDEYAKLLETQAAGQPQNIAAQASYEPAGVNFDPNSIVPVDVNPFDPLQNYTVEFFDMYDERASLMRDQTSQMFGNMGSAASAFYQMSGQKSKEWFAIQKGFNIAQAIMNTYEGATKALAQGGFWGIAMAATVIASGLAQVAMIASQQPGTSGGGAHSTGGSVSITSYSGGQTNNNSNNKNAVFNITINGVYQDNDELARDLIPAIKKAYGDTLGGGN